MPTIRTLAEFKTSIPNDEVVAGRFVQFGGRGVAVAIGEMLREQGFSVDQPYYGKTHWQFFARIAQDKAKTKLWFEVVQADESIMTAEDATFTIFAKKDPTMLAKTLVRLNEQMAADHRFSDVLWYTPAAYDHGRRGSPAPIT